MANQTLKDALARMNAAARVRKENNLSIADQRQIQQSLPRNQTPITGGTTSNSQKQATNNYVDSFYNSIGYSPSSSQPQQQMGMSMDEMQRWMEEFMRNQPPQFDFSQFQSIFDQMSKDNNARFDALQKMIEDQNRYRNSQLHPGSYNGGGSDGIHLFNPGGTGDGSSGSSGTSGKPIGHTQDNNTNDALYRYINNIWSERGGF